MAYSIPYKTFNEGQQAEEYLKRKMKEKEERDSEDNKYIYKGEVPGRRAAAVDKFTGHDISHARSIYDKSAEFGPGVFDITTKFDPKHKTAYEIEKHREKYNDVMPIAQTKAERRLEKDRNKEIDSRVYASEMIKKKVNEYEPGSSVTGEYRSSVEAQRAHDAARRHYRRTHKNESVGIFESVEFI